MKKYYTKEGKEVKFGDKLKLASRDGAVYASFEGEFTKDDIDFLIDTKLLRESEVVTKKETIKDLFFKNIKKQFPDIEEDEANLLYKYQNLISSQINVKHHDDIYKKMASTSFVARNGLINFIYTSITTDFDDWFTAGDKAKAAEVYVRYYFK